jgi:dTDP-4-dehydrorhamnose 3,5-epimerase
VEALQKHRLNIERRTIVKQSASPANGICESTKNMPASFSTPNFEIVETPLPGVRKVSRKVSRDHRGGFGRLFCSEELSAAGWKSNVAQINHSFTTFCGTIRGLHFQFPPYAEMKLVSCIRGEVWDVAVDLRQGSPTFLRWHAELLSPQNGAALIIPEGVAHGFQLLSDESELIYCHSVAFTASAEGGCRFDDPAIGISWPLPPCNQSPRDLSLPLLKPDFTGIGL